MYGKCVLPSLHQRWGFAVTRFDRHHVRRTAERAVEHYDDFAVPYRDICARLLERLDYIKCQPRLVADLGTGTGQGALALARRYPRAEVLALDPALGMVRQVKRRRRWRRRPRSVCAEAERLPLVDASVDLVFSSGALHWCSDYRALFVEIRRVLRPGGVLLFATFGPDTLMELRAAWSRVDDQPHVHEFVDMHQLGDAMLAAGLVDPVVDAEWLTVNYASAEQLMKDLKGSGASNARRDRSTGLRGRRQLEALRAGYPLRPGGNGISATYEVVYGHAWGAPGSGEAKRVEVELQRLPR